MFKGLGDLGLGFRGLGPERVRDVGLGFRGLGISGLGASGVRVEG